MSIGEQIHSKLITDLATLTFDGGATIFNNVKPFFAEESMASSDCLLIPDSVPEIITGQSAGNIQTTRQYGFRIIVYEEIEASTTDSEGAVKYSRLLNTTDALLDYLQKEPSNLNAWGATNDINIFKIRVQNPIYDTQKSQGGYVGILDMTFSIYLNVIPQNL